MPTMQKSFAVIIGIADYDNVRKLPSAVIKDATDIYDILIDKAYCSYPKENVQIITDKKASRLGIISALDKLIQSCDDDSSVLIYISCHGARIETGVNAGEYILPVDVMNSSSHVLSNTSISSELFTTYIEKLKARKLVVIFDCCHSGGIGQIKGYEENLNFKTGISEQYYSLLGSGRGRVILASSRSTELSWIMPGDSNSLFTKHLLGGLRGGVIGSGGVIRIFDLFNYIQTNVTSSQTEQHPFFKAQLEDNFPIALYLGGKSIPTNSEKIPESGKYTYDVFLSYRHHEPEKTWVRKILLPRLETAGLRVLIDFRDFRLGAPLVTEMARGVEQSKFTLAILTPAYLESSFTELESILSEHLGLEISQRRLIALMREECNPRLGLRARQWLDMTQDAEFEINIQRLIYEVTNFG